MLAFVLPPSNVTVDPLTLSCTFTSVPALLDPRASAHHLTMRSAFPPPALSIHIPNKQSSQM